MGNRVVKGGQEWSKWSSGVKSGQSGQVGSRVIKWGLEWSIEWSRGSRVVSDYLKKNIKISRDRKYLKTYVFRSSLVLLSLDQPGYCCQDLNIKRDC